MHAIKSSCLDPARELESAEHEVLMLPDRRVRASVEHVPVSGVFSKSLRSWSTTALRTLALLLFTVTLTSGLARAADFFVLVSDVDDTVKITNALDSDKAFWNALHSELVFAGMPELYRHLLGENSPAERLMFLSGSPFFLNHKVAECLEHAHFPAHRLTLLGAGDPSSPLRYKRRHMRKLYGASKDNFLLVGDDEQSDPEVYEAFSALRRNHVLGIYIHRIAGRELPPGNIPFVTAYDIAMHEFVARRLNENQAAYVGEAVLASPNSTFLPDFQQCPEGYEKIEGLPKALVQLKEQIERRMTTLCSSRRNIKSQPH